MATQQNKTPLKQIVEKNRKPLISMIKAANKQKKQLDEATAQTAKMLSQLAESAGVSVEVLYERVTHLLANIAMKADAGEPIELMHVNSIGAFLAGVEAIAKALPVAPDEEKRANALRVLATAGMGPDGTINNQTFPIVNLGAKKEARHKQMTQLVTDYMSSQTRGQPDGRALAQTARSLQQDVDRVMRSSAQPRSMAPTGPARGGTAPGHL